MQIATTTCNFKVGTGSGTTVPVPVAYDMGQPGTFAWPVAGYVGTGLQYRADVREVCITEINDYISILYIPAFLTIFLLVILVMLKIFDFKNHWKN